MQNIRKFLKVDFQLLPVKSHYFLFFAGLACALPFRTVFAKQLGVSATAVGIIFLAAPLLKIFTNPLFGFVLDYFKKFRLTVSIILIIVAFSHVAMVFIPQKQNLMKKNKELETMFHVGINYSCREETSKDYVPGLEINSQYESSYEMEHSFSCDIKCEATEGRTGSLELKKMKEHLKALEQNLIIEFNLAVAVKVSLLEISIINEQFFVFHEGARLIAWLDTNETSENYSNVFTYQNKSVGVISDKENNSHNNLNNGTENIKNFTLSAFSEISDERTSKLQMLGNTKMKYTTMNKFVILTDVDRIIIKNGCKVKFHCSTKKCQLRVSDAMINEMPEEDEFLSVQFWSLFILIAISTVTLSAVIFLMDTICYEVLSDKKEKYGEQRLWGTIGWGLGALAGGYINEIFSPTKTYIDYAPSFYLLAILTIIDLIPTYKLKVENVKYSTDICKDVGFLLSQIHVIANVAIVFVIGILSGLIWNYQFWFMEEIGSSQVLLGLSQTVECIIAEVPCFLISGWVIRKVGYANCNNITFLCFGLRYLCFSYMHDPWMTLPVGLLHGPTFGLFYASMTMYAKSEAPPGTEASVQSLMSMSFEGVGAAIGCILGGVGFDKVGSRATFRYSAAVSFIMLAINIILQFSILKRKTINPKEVSLT